MYREGHYNLEECTWTDITIGRKVQGTDITSRRNVQGTDITSERNIQWTDFTIERNVQGQTLQANPYPD